MNKSMKSIQTEELASSFMELFKVFWGFHEIQAEKASIKVPDSLSASWCLNYNSTTSHEIDILFKIYKLFLLC